MLTRKWFEITCDFTGEQTQEGPIRSGLHGQRFVTRRQAKDEVIAWLLWYNQTRLHSTLAYVSPVRFEQDWLATQAKQLNS